MRGLRESGLAPWNLNRRQEVENKGKETTQAGAPCVEPSRIWHLAQRSASASARFRYLISSPRQPPAARQNDDPPKPSERGVVAGRPYARAALAYVVNMSVSGRRGGDNPVPSFLAGTLRVGDTRPTRQQDIIITREREPRL